MSSPEQERLDAISESLLRLLKRQDELEARLRRLEGDENHRENPPRTPPPVPVARPAPIAPPTRRETPALETRVGLNWINRIGVVTLLFAAAFGFEYAAQNNWIGPGTRIALGLIAAVACAFFGDRMRQRQHEIFAQGLSGLGLALSYLTLYASFTIYHVFPQSLAFILMVLTTCAAAALALRYRSQAIAILAIAGGYLTPILLSTGTDHPSIFFSYTFLVNIGALAIARTQDWPALEYIATGATAVLYTFWFAGHFTDSQSDVATISALAFYAQFATSDRPAVWAIAQILIAFLIPSVWHTPTPILLLALLVAAAGLIAAEFRRWSFAPCWTLGCYYIAYLLWRMNHKDHESVFALLTCGFVLFAVWIFYRAISKRRVFHPVELLVIASNGAAYFAASSSLLDHAYIGAIAVLLGGIHLAIAKLLWTDDEAAQRPALLALGVTLAYLTLAIPIQLAGFRITIAWSLEAAALAFLGARFLEARFQFASWIVFILAAYRLLLFDASLHESATIVNARFLTFAVAAVSLWLAARFAREGIEAAAPYLAGHVALLAGFALEIGGWAERNASPENVWNSESIAFSILLALYAVGVIALGVAARTPINRLLGLALLAIVVAKLYLSDVWSLGMGFRIAAFLALGVLLLLVSYLYSRFKPVIERLWKNDRQTGFESDH
jgi:Predicted membrane protein (DUF2339)